MAMTIFSSRRAAMGGGVEPELQTNHERIRRELWAAIYRQAHEQSAVRVQPQFRFTEDADKAVADFDRRFGAPKEYHPDFSGLPSCPGSAAPAGVQVVPAVSKEECAKCNGTDEKPWCELTQSEWCGRSNPELVKPAAETDSQQTPMGAHGIGSTLAPAGASTAGGKRAWVEAGWRAAIDCHTHYGMAGWSSHRSLYLESALREAGQQDAPVLQGAGQVELPPLPEPHWARNYRGIVPLGAFSEEQMQDYARAALQHGGEAPVARWISVDERMPEPGTDCLVWCTALGPGRHFAKVDRWDEQREAPLSWSSATIPIGLGWDDSDPEDVTHWMPLPAAPGSTPPKADAPVLPQGEGDDLITPSMSMFASSADYEAEIRAIRRREYMPSRGDAAPGWLDSPTPASPRVDSQDEGEKR